MIDEKKFLDWAKSRLQAHLDSNEKDRAEELKQVIDRIESGRFNVDTEQFIILELDK